MTGNARSIAREWMSASEPFATIVRGDCMVPDIADGECIAIDPTAPVSAGDLVIVVKRPERMQDGEPPGALKRLVGRIKRSRIPFELREDEELEPCLFVEMTNPPKRMFVPYSAIGAVFKCIGKARRSDDGQSAWIEPWPTEAAS